MECFDRFKKKMELYGGSIRDEKILDSKRYLEATFDDDGSLTKGIYLWELGVKSYDDKQPLRIRLYKRTFSTANGSNMKFQTPINIPIIIGDIIYDSKNDEYWICEESFNIDDIHWQGKFYQCNWILKWQNAIGEILEYPCKDINSTQYNSGETSNAQFTLATSQHQLTLPCDENTVMLKSPQRFYLDKNYIEPTSFIVTQNDTTSYNYGKKGLVKVTVTQYPNDSANDRPDLGICDYIEPINKNCNSNISLDLQRVEIDCTSDVIKSGGDYQTYTAKFYNGKKELSDIKASWDVICEFKDFLDINIIDNQIRIGIDNDDFIDEDIKLICSDIEKNCYSTLIIKVESLF